MDLTDKSQLLEYLKKNGIWAKKGLSQNFLVDREALVKIVKAAEIKEGELVFEIGPGAGVLTRELIDSQAQIKAIELDKHLATLLNDQLGESIEVINQDILDINIARLTDNIPYKVVANIPYAITSKILKLFLTQENKPSMLVMLVQKEVAERICAKPGDMSVLAVSVQAYGIPEIVGIVPAESFFPAPKVDSAILKIKIFQSSMFEDGGEKELFRCVKIGFSSKRKKLINNLSAGYHLSRDIIFDIMKKSNISDNIRAEDLSIEEWLRLSQGFSSYK